MNLSMASVIRYVTRPSDFFYEHSIFVSYLSSASSSNRINLTKYRKANHTLLEQNRLYEAIVSNIWTRWTIP